MTDETNVNQMDDPIPLEKLSAEQRASIEKFQTEPGFLMIKQIVNLKDDPRLLILVAHGFVELMINALIDDKLKNAKRITSDSRGYPHSTKLLILNEVGVLDNNLYRAFDWFRKLRNKAAHKPLFELTKNDLQNLKYPHSEPENFHNTVIELVLGFWNSHTELFGRVFIPGQNTS